MSVCIVGRDPVAMIFAAEIAAKAAPVTVCGLPSGALEIIAKGGCPFPEEPGLESRLKNVMASNTLRASAPAQLVMIFESVELDENRQPDYTRLEAIIAEVAQGLAPEKTVLFDGMLRVGDTRGRLGPLLERISGLRMGKDFAVAYSPERCRPGHAITDIRVTPKIVAAEDDATSMKLASLLQNAFETFILRANSIETAEYTHLIEGAVRDVNAALAIEFAQRAQAHGIDLREALAIVDTRSGFPLRTPGLDVDDPEVTVAAALLNADDASAVEPCAAAGLLALGLKINESAVPRAVVRLEQALGGLHGKDVALIVDEVDPRGPAPGSSLRQLVAALQEAGARTRIVDPARKEGRETVEVIIHLGWRTPFAALELNTYPRCRHILDGTSMLGRRRVEAAGFTHLGVV